MSATEDSGDLCTRCAESALSMCVECSDMLCRAHVDPATRSGPWGFKSRLGSQLAICHPCGRKRLWRYLRGAGVLILLALALILWMEQLPIVAVVLVGLLSVWWVTATRMTRQAEQDLSSARQASP